MDPAARIIGLKMASIPPISRQEKHLNTIYIVVIFFSAKVQTSSAKRKTTSV